MRIRLTSWPVYAIVFALLLAACAPPASPPATFTPLALTQAVAATPTSAPAAPTVEPPTPTVAPTATVAPPTSTPPPATATAEPAAAPTATSAPTGSTSSLESEDNDGLPVPADHTMLSSESAPFRRNLTATSPSKLADVLQLYRVELTARNWAELPATVAPTDERADLAFTNPEQGNLALQLTRNSDGGTDIALTIRDEAAAKAANALPPSGQARIYFASILDAPATFNAGGKEVKVAAAGPDDSMANAPFIDVAPGKHSFTLTPSGGPAANDEIQVAAGEIWILAAGPGGALAVQAY